MMKIPLNFSRGFDEMPRVKSCESSGSEHSAADLSDLVNSFLEKETIQERRSDEELLDDETGSNSRDSESQNILKILFSHENDAIKRSIREEVQNAYGEADGRLSSSPDFKRRLMARLRDKGFDAGICKSRWEKDGGCPSGSYEYIDVEANGVRYVVETRLVREFTIARPSGGYASLLQIFPEIYVGRAEEVKEVVRVMCNGIRRSMKKGGIHVPPWRRRAYMHSKWFASYKRTTNEISSGERLQRMQGITLRCREVDFGGLRTGNLAALFNTNELIL